MKTTNRLVLFTRSLSEDLGAVPSLAHYSPKRLEAALKRQFMRELDRHVPKHGVKSLAYLSLHVPDSYGLIAAVKTTCKTTKAFAYDIQARFYDDESASMAGSFEVAR